MGRIDEKTDEAKGRLKEAAGDLTDDRDLEREGKLDQAKASVKGAAHDAADKVSELADRIGEKLDDDRS